MDILTNLSLFSGVGGFDLAAKWTGRIRTVGYCEFDPYAQSVLQSRFRDGGLEEAPIWDDVTTFDGRPWRGSVDIISGGFPCQDVSFAGKRAGLKSGTRSGLWSHFARIICEIRPKFVLVENVPGLLSSHTVFCEFCRDGKGWKAKEKYIPPPEDQEWDPERKIETRPICCTCGRLVDHGRERFIYAMGRVLGDLAEMGMDAKWGVWGASDVGAQHRRNRVWIVAYSSESQRRTGTKEQRELRKLSKNRRESDNLDRSGSSHSGGDVADSPEHRRKQRGSQPKRQQGRFNAPKRSLPMADTDNGTRSKQPREQQKKRTKISRTSGEIRKSDLADSNSPRRKDFQRRTEVTERSGSGATGNEGRWNIEPDVGRVAHGVAFRVDRLRCCGNGVVPQQALPAWEEILKMAFPQ